MVRQMAKRYIDADVARSAFARYGFSVSALGIT
jgi:hypothetical protein